MRALFLILLIVGSGRWNRAEDPGPSNSVRRGELLAHVYCQSCHLFPEPSLLDKRSWVNGALRRMAPLLGVARIDLSNRPDGGILKDANIFPNTPLVSEADWRAIVHYYYESAPETPLPQKPQASIKPELRLFKSRPLRYPGASALTTLVRIDPGRARIYVGNAAARSLDLVSTAGQLLSRVSLPSTPVDLAVRPEGVYLTLVGNLFPSDERNGQIVLLTQTNGVTRFVPLIDHLSRPTSMLFADVNADGKDELVVCSFGNYLGKLAWYERSGAGFVEHPLLEQPGAVNAAAAFPGPAQCDLYVLMAQAREGIHRYRNEKGSWRRQVLLEFSSAFGSSHLELTDLNGDGLPDLLVTNGDNGDYPSQPKNYHGIRIYLNDGRGAFQESWFYALHGAFKAMAADFDRDGYQDLAAISFFPDYRANPLASFVLLKGAGNLQFSPLSFEDATQGRWLTMDVADLDGDGDRDIVLGSFAEGPASVAIPAALQERWRTNGYSVLVLENQTAAR